MSNCSFYFAKDVAQVLGISESYAYKIIHKLNTELKEKGYLTISGCINKQYFLERTCYGKTNEFRKE